MNNNPEPLLVTGLFPCPVYIVKRASKYTLDGKPVHIPVYDEEIEIGNIINEGMQFNGSNSSSINSYIFDTKLKQIKQFCEEHIKIYVEQVICPTEGDLDFYITQSWLNVNKPGEYHYEHCHTNSIISGVFYISTEEDDKITFIDPSYKLKDRLKFETKAYNIWNTDTYAFQSNSNELMLFPSWLNHMVDSNPKATTDRISISFNTYVRGTIGDRLNKNELILR
jgi:uncharacterized protein (TIGR02466 family)